MADVPAGAPLGLGGPACQQAELEGGSSTYTTACGMLMMWAMHVGLAPRAVRAASAIDAIDDNNGVFHSHILHAQAWRVRLPWWVGRRVPRDESAALT